MSTSAIACIASLTQRAADRRRLRRVITEHADSEPLPDDAGIEVDHRPRSAPDADQGGFATAPASGIMPTVDDGDHTEDIARRAYGKTLGLLKRSRQSMPTERKI